MKRGAIVFAALGALTLGAFAWGLSLSRDSDDEMIYTALAAKLRASGLAGYTLRDVSIRTDGDTWRFEPEPGGNLLRKMPPGTSELYDRPVFFNPPFFPALVAVSHELFNRGEPFRVVRRGLPAVLRPEQAYAVIVNALFAALFLAGVYALGCGQSPRAGLVAAVICLASPIFLVAALKTWTDLPAATLVLWSLLCRRRGVASSPAWIALSGALFGLACLTRTASLCAAPLFFTRRWDETALWAACATAVAGPWFFWMGRTYGNPLYVPSVETAAAWRTRIERPWHDYLKDLALLSPAFLFAFAAPARGRLFWGAWFVFVLAPMAILLKSGKPIGLEDRYLLPAYPALAAAAAAGFERLERRLGVWAWAAAAACLVWSFRLGWMFVNSRESILFLP